MRPDLTRAARFLAVPTLVLVVIVAFFQGRVELAIRIYALVLCGVAVLLMVAALRRAYPPVSPLRARLEDRGERRGNAPPPLERLRQEVALGVAGSFDLHHRLRPRLRDLALELLEAKHGAGLDAEPERAKRILGEETWELVREGRAPPDDRLAPGIAVSELRLVVESLERA